MNKVVMMGRLTKDPETRVSQGDKPFTIASFSLAVDRKYQKDKEKETDFFNCTAFGKQAEFVDKYLKQGTKILLSGRVENNNYTNREGQKVYGVKIMVEEIEFAESKNSQQINNQDRSPKNEDGFMSIPDGIDEELPFN